MWNTTICWELRKECGNKSLGKVNVPERPASPKVSEFDWASCPPPLQKVLHCHSVSYPTTRESRLLNCLSIFLSSCLPIMLFTALPVSLREPNSFTAWQWVEQLLRDHEKVKWINQIVVFQSQTTLHILSLLFYRGWRRAALDWLDNMNVARCKDPCPYNSIT